MRILFLNSSGQLGGAEISLLDMLASLRAAVPDWPLQLLIGEPGPLADRARNLGVTVQVVEFPAAIARLGDAGAGGPAGRQVGRLALVDRLLSAGPALLRYRTRLRRAIVQAAPDVLHSNGMKMDVLGIWARPSGKPLIWHIHDYVTRRPLMRALLRRYAGQCSAAVANSHSTAKDLATVCGDGLKTYTVHNGVDLRRFSPDGPRADLEQLAGLPPAVPGTIRIGIVATLARWKGQEVFLEAISKLQVKLPKGVPVYGYIIGDAIYQTDGSQYQIEELRALASRLGIQDRTGFTGFLPDPAAAMRALDIVVHASTQPEPFGLAIVEAMACGRAVIASEAGGAAEIVAAGNGVLGHPPGDAEALASCMERLVTDSGLRARMGQQARDTAERFFDRARLAAQLVPIYREAAGETGMPLESLGAKCSA